MKKRLAIVGNGMAASRLLDELVRRNAAAQFEVSVFGEESRGAYNRILLGRVLSGEAPEAIALKPAEWYVDRGVTFHAGVRVAQIDPVGRRLTTSTGDAHPYDVCVLATGSSPLVPPVTGLKSDDGSPRDGVHVFRTVEDCIAIRDRAKPGSCAVVVGGGLLGLEAAKALGDLGLRVTVLHLNEVLMSAQLDKHGGELLRLALEKTGLFVRTGTTADEVIGNGHVEAVRLRTGEVVPADLVVFACGIVPRVEVAKASGVPVNRAVLVNDLLATQVPGVYAVGECAEHNGLVYGLVQPIWEQCAVLADVLTGTNPRARYRGSKIYARLKVAGVEVASFGVPDAQLPTDEVLQVFEERRGVYRKLIVRDGKLVGAMLVGCAEAAPALVQMFDRDEPLPQNRLDVLATGNAPTAATEREICNCNHVTEAALVGAIRDGCDTLPALCEATRAGTGCGSCRGQLVTLLATHAPVAAR
ncbi:Nitrite reductase [NAD(P)H] [Gemmata obscuriglobus]|uniref:NAD(P)/FAD-dependent oxidoreductase n=1 Tax=Gemmata obscuriglobus TaxID=114 RepID=A0A2Z3H9C8_9BACT|nr:FAD-dependent oxidoreductase [Gemmata obscuriglobus]AWM38284.1 NAD(P)/FAD-dependent oxidoreductase [Gemmata obscuriglobus]QEG28804.1 Nitrite reductase [NAD(P)H] [Gemmata obscuriglobus]VTS07178.1 nitrite reductase : Nitrite reductase OS=Sorangium cellulosum So0157-2 GN=SCE1572_21175 PE=4 SV=1: Pyr_redox_2: Pyr_redox: Fer2_BFD [Gemmata obscuriglobus UQM 2246]